MKTLSLLIILVFSSILVGCSSEKSASNDSDNAHSVDYRLYEDAEGQDTAIWSVREGSSADATIGNVYDTQKESHVIEFQGNGTNDAYIAGAERGELAWNEQEHFTISWEMQYAEDAVIYVMVETTEGVRYLFYTPSHVRGLLHGFERGIMHGLGGSIRDGRWRKITRDLQSDLQDAEPDNQLMAVNGIIVRGSGRIDNLLLYTPTKRMHENGENGTDAWEISDSDPEGATVQRSLDAQQGQFIAFEGEGVENAYSIALGNREEQLLQWRFRGFGDVPREIESSGEIRDPNAFAFRVFVTTRFGERELLYTLGFSNLGLLESDVIHHGLGDDRTLGSILVGSGNTLGLWQTITRDIEEDIWDFEPDNQLLHIDRFEVRGSGFVDDLQSFYTPSI